jgi:hypothetical protein
VGRLEFSKLGLVILSNVLFALLLRRLGLAGALILLVVVSSYASKRFRWPVALTILAVIVLLALLPGRLRLLPIWGVYVLGIAMIVPIAAVGLTYGSDADWDSFSVQWDGVLVVHRPIRLAPKSDDAAGSRLI